MPKSKKDTVLEKTRGGSRRIIPKVEPKPERKSTANAKQEELRVQHGEIDIRVNNLLNSFFAVAQRIIAELEPLARKYRVIGGIDSFPEHMAKQLREEISGGMFEWAVRKMGKDLRRYLEEGRTNFMDHFKLLLYDPYRGKPRGMKEFLEAFEGAEFFIPLRFGRREIHHENWPQIYEQYRKTLLRIQEIWRKTGRNFSTRKLKLMKEFSLPTQFAEEFFDVKPSEVTLEIIRIQCRLRRIKTETLRKYLRHIPGQYTYLDYIFDNLRRIKASRYSSLQ